MRKILKNSWTKHLSLTYNEKYKYCNRARPRHSLRMVNYTIFSGDGHLVRLRLLRNIVSCYLSSSGILDRGILYFIATRYQVDIV